MPDTNYSLQELSIEELKALIGRAENAIRARKVRNTLLRNDLEKKAKAAGISNEEAAILFGAD